VCHNALIGIHILKILVISLIILFSLSVGVVGVTQGIPWDDPSLVELSLQVQLRDSEGRLVAYYEPTRSWVDPKTIHRYLDTQENKKIIEKDGKNYEVFELEQTLTYRGNELATGFVIFQDGIVYNTAFSDGFLPEPGDVAFQSWKIVRLLN